MNNDEQHIPLVDEPVAEPTPEPEVVPAPEPEVVAPAEEKLASRSTIPTEGQLVVALLILAGLFGISYIPALNDKEPAVETAEKIPDQNASNEAAPIQTEDISLEAHAAFVWDVARQRAIFNKNASVQLPLASLTKLMTSLVAVETLGEPGSVPITLAAIQQEGESGLTDGERFNVRSLSSYVLTSSSNDGAYALAAAAGAALGTQNEEGPDAFIRAMNIRAEEIGLSQTYYTNPTGLDANAVESGSYGSARDTAFLMEYLIAERPELLEDTTKHLVSLADESGAIHSATNTNEIVDEIPGILGSKTGFTDLAGGNLVIAFDAGLNRPVIVSVLGSSREGRFTDVLKLVEYARKQIAAE